ncbi:MAG: OmpH family outer membrane protein [Polyangia bacterium]
MQNVLGGKKVLGTLIAASIISTAAGRAAADDVKIAVVDLRRALNETNEGKQAMKKLTRHKNKLQKKISAKEKEILEMKQTIEKQQNVLNKEALQKKVEQYYQAVTELQQTYMQFQRELVDKESEATEKILSKMAKIMKEIGREAGYTMVFDSSAGAVIWAPSHLDLTDKLIQRYNAKY